MNGWLVIGLIVLGLAAVALAILVSDIARGDVGGGRHTMQRARRLLVVATDAETYDGAERWIRLQRIEHPDRQFLVLSEPETADLYLDVQAAVERERPDAIVVALHGDEHHATHEGLYGQLKADLVVPVDAIYIERETAP